MKNQSIQARNANESSFFYKKLLLNLRIWNKSIQRCKPTRCHVLLIENTSRIKDDGATCYPAYEPNVKYTISCHHLILFQSCYSDEQGEHFPYSAKFNKNSKKFNKLIVEKLNIS